MRSGPNGDAHIRPTPTEARHCMPVDDCIDKGQSRCLLP